MQISKNIKSGLAWSFINQVTGQIIFIVFNICLTRLLTPEAFGLVGIVTVFSGFASYFVDAGFGAALIQKKEITHIQLCTIFWLNIAMGVFLVVLFYSMAPYIAAFYHQAALVVITRVIALTFLISAFGVVQNALMLRQMNFKRKTIINWVSLCLSYLVSVIMAYYGLGYWAIAAYLLLNAFTSCVLTWFTSNWRPSFQFSINEFRQVAPFGLSVLGDSSVNYWARNADNFLIGKYLGTVQLGIYSRAYAIMMLPMKNISSVISSVMFPAFSSIQNNVVLIKQYYMVTIKYVAFICFPLMVGLALLAKDFTIVFFGVKWIAMAAVLKWLCLLAALQSVLSLNGIIYKSLGKAKLAFTVTLVVSTVLVIAFIIGIYYKGLNGLVIAYFITSLSLMLPIYATALKLINTRLYEVLVHLRAPLAGTLLMALLLLVTKYFITVPVNAGFFFLQVILALAVYAAMVHLFDKKLIAGLLKQLNNKQY